jgi:hypothetical protein
MHERPECDDILANRQLWAYTIEEFYKSREYSKYRYLIQINGIKLDGIFHIHFINEKIKHLKSA